MKPSKMSDEVRAMIDLRHSAEQRGEFDTIGRLLALHTDKGVMRWPTVDGECSGPDIGQAWNGSQLVMVGQWFGLPPLRMQSTTERCKACERDCDTCGGTGKQTCQGQMCGGRGFIDGPFVPCPGPGCRGETGKFKPGCDVCISSGSQGEVPEKKTCPMCSGSRLMTCQRCRGTLKFSTCHIDGSIDWTSALCAACEGSGYAGKWVLQNASHFENARLRRSRKQRGARLHDEVWLVLGPILSFDLIEYPNLHAKTYTILPDEKGDLLMLLVPGTQSPSRQKAYLVGGVVKELTVKQAVGA
jgi:hypothetical protein